MKSFKIGEKRPEKIKEGMGPGTYSPERAEALTKHKQPNINMGSSPARPSSFAKVGDLDVAPGQYHHEKKFGVDTKSFRIGEKRDVRTEQTAGPGYYEPEKGETLTKQKIPNINLGSSQARPTSLALGQDMDVAPGQYDDGIRFNSNTKSFRIGEKRTEIVQEGMGPGAYSPERADALTKYKQPNINLGSSPARPGTFAKVGDLDVAPGQYNYEKKFGQDTKAFRIGEKRETLIENTAGPGTYDHTKADAVTKQKIPNINLGSSPARPDKMVDQDTNVAPGQYDDGIRFNSNIKSFRIGEKRAEKVQEGMGPGAYSPERADGMTKEKIPNINLGSSQARPTSLAQNQDMDVAPGQYNYEKKFGVDTKSFRIGENREVSI